MKSFNLHKAVHLANRFIEEAKKCQEMDAPMSEYIEPGEQAAATKRASMDLTKALAKLRHTR
jgi:hypothetical protein